MACLEAERVLRKLHQAVYDVRDGSVVHSPSLYREPTYDVRVRDGKIELKSQGE
jgi:nitrite reductase/ring-hydroxylating ferredoxin subunit